MDDRWMSKALPVLALSLDSKPMSKIRLTVTPEDCERLIAGISFAISDTERGLIEIDDIYLRKSLKNDRTELERVLAYLKSRLGPDEVS